jgi:hypothetical protein
MVTSAAERIQKRRRLPQNPIWAGDFLYWRLIEPLCPMLSSNP